MRTIQEVLRQKWSLGRPHREAAQSLGLGMRTVTAILQKESDCRALQGPSALILDWM